MKKVSIIIPNWNGEKILERCLLSIKTLEYPSLEVIVVDNGSTDNSIEIARTTYPNVKVINLGKNYGFAYPVNAGIRKSTGENIFLLNNDAEVEKNCLKYMEDILHETPEVIGVTGRIFNIKNKNYLDSAGDTMNIIGQPFSRGVGDSPTKWEKPGFVFLITAAGSLFRKKAFNDVGFFDESFFAYYEDVDWCLRAQLKGYKFWYEPRAIIYHEHKFTSKKNPNFLEYLQFRNQMQLVIKNFPWQLFFKRLRWIKIPIVHIHNFYFFIQKGLFKEALLAQLWIISHLITLFFKRVEIQKRRRVSLDYLEKLMNDKKIKIGSISF